mmetsp:Transcript_8295/g.9909  ORF Transcript_8295/g.9909 Transcript_8295/m.9909 type:complete len:131 (-) Transcript_8295:29-421(-)
MSLAAWGQLQESSSSGQDQPALKILSFELGVLFFDEACHNDDNKIDDDEVKCLPLSTSLTTLSTSTLVASPLCVRYLPLPYEINPAKLKSSEEPWMNDKPYVKQDGLGRQWPMSVCLYGAGATSRQHLAI